MDALPAVLEYPSAREAALSSAPPLELAPAGEYVRALRPQHWLKNLLTFIPLFAAHLFLQPFLLERTVAIFLAFCCCASSGYLINDLCDLAADRRHPRKRLRPFASGRLSLAYGRAAAPSLAIAGCTLAWMVSEVALAIVVLYLVVTVAYSLSFKKIEVLDVVVLASLYTLRMVGGAAAIELWPSIWLFAFSMFLFISLALVKRYAELMTMRGVDGERARARGYQLSDAELLSSTGTTSGYAAVLVLALYIATGAAQTLYSRHQLMWLVCPLLLYWIGYVWLKAHRGQMHHDPLVFALRDGRSRIVLLLMVAVAAVAI